MKKYCILLAGILTLIPGLSVRAADFGVILDQSASYGGRENDGAFEYSGALIPWLSALAGDNGNFNFSASAMADWKNDTLTIIPELLRTEFSTRFGGGEFKLGRMRYTDPLDFIANGLFDGVYIALDAGGGSVSLGAWYTGLLYKDRAHITMTAAEKESYNTVFDYNDFTDTYFAPRRVLSAINWEHPSLAERAQIKLALLGQFDLSGEDTLHSQYAAGKVSIPILPFVFDLGGCLELLEFADEFKIALAGELGIAYMFSSARLSLSGRYSCGTAEDGSLMAFLPLTTVYQGNVLKAKLSGLSVVSLDYLGRLHRTLSAGFAASCFLRSDLGTYNAYPVTAGAGYGYILGTELFGRLIWAPLSDIQLNAGGGVFLPSLGNAAPDAAALWRVEMNLVLALY